MVRKKLTKILSILFLSILLSAEMEVDGDLKVTGTIQNDSLAQVILLQQQQISALEALISQLQAQMTNLLANDDCNIEVPGIQFLDACGDCEGDITDEENCPNYALSFDGVDDYVEYGGNNLPIGNSDRTMSCWVRPLVVDQYSLFGYGNQDENTAFEIFFYDDNGTLRPSVHYAYGNSGYENGLEVNLNEWNHLVATYDGISSRIYVNGEISITDIQPLNTEKVYRHIGAPNYTAPTTPGYFLDGIIKGCAIWNNTLTDNEINSLYNNGNHIDLSSNYEDYLSSDNLVAHFKFNAGTGDILYDHSGNENHGTIHGATWVER